MFRAGDLNYKMSLWSTCKRKQLTEGSRDSRADIGSDSTTAGPPLLTRSRRYCPSWNTIPIFTPSRFLLFQSSSLLFELITFSFPGPVDSPYMTASASEHLLEVPQKTSFSSLLALQSTCLGILGIFEEISAVRATGAAFQSEILLLLNSQINLLAVDSSEAEIGRGGFVGYLKWRGRRAARQTLLAMRNRRQASESRRPSLILSSAAPLLAFSTKPVLR